MVLALSSVFSDDIAIDLGTANTLVYVAGKGIVIDEPSVVAVRSHGDSREVLAIGAKAKAMIGRTPENIEALRPLRDGVIADFVATEQMLRDFISRTRRLFGFRRPRIVISVPAGATPVDRKSVYDTALSAGARKVYLIFEPVAAAIGAGLPVDEPTASMVVDIGGGTTDIAVLSLGGVIQARSLRCAGDAMDEAIARYIRRQHRLVIGATNAERIKVEAGTARSAANDPPTEIHINGRDLQTGRPKSIVLGPQDVATALDPPIEQIAEFVQRTLEDLPPELASDICEHGIQLTGGGAELTNLDLELGQRVGVAFTTPERPEHCVILGTAAVLEHLRDWEPLLIEP